jgi:hypothetical protein
MEKIEPINHREHKGEGGARDCAATKNPRLCCFVALREAFPLVHDTSSHSQSLRVRVHQAYK